MATRNGKQAIRDAVASKKAKSFEVFGNAINPLAEEIRDPDDLRLMLERYPHIPFLEGGAAGFRFFELMRKYSPTHSSICNNKITYATGGGWRLVYGLPIGLARSRNNAKELSDADEATYIQFIQSWTNFEKLLSLANQQLDNFETYGNAYYEIIIEQFAGNTYIRYRNHDADRVRYKFNGSMDISGNQSVYISACWSWDFLQKNPPLEVAVYPNFSQMSDGTLRSVVHLKHDVVNREWYGEPSSEGSLMYQFTEYQLAVYNNNQYANDFSAKIIISVEDDFMDTEDAIERKRAFRDHIDKFTNQKAGKSVLLHTRGTGQAPANVNVINAPQNYEYHKVTAEIAEGQIFKSHDWHPTLLVKTAGQLGGASEFDIVYKTKYKTVIRPLQSKIEDHIQKLVSVAESILGFVNPNNIRLQLDNMFAESVIAEPQPSSAVANNVNVL